MNCIWVEKLSSLIDGELPSEEARALELHLVGCMECQQARADFLNFRNQIIAFSPALDRSASRQVLDSILAKEKVRRPLPARSRGLFGALRFNPAFAAVAVLIIAGIISAVLYRSANRQMQRPPSGELANGVRPSPRPSATPESTRVTGPSGPERNPKASGGKGSKQKTRPVFVPKVPSVPDNRISPWANQVIAENSSDSDAPGDGVRAVDSQMMTARHFEQSELLLRSFRNVRTGEGGERAEIAYERQRAQRLVYQNIMLRREADSAGDVQVSTLLESLEPILLDIANLPNKPLDQDVNTIKDRMQRKNLVAMLQVNSTALARANE